MASSDVMANKHTDPAAVDDRDPRRDPGRSAGRGRDPADPPGTHGSLLCSFEDAPKLVGGRLERDRVLRLLLPFAHPRGPSWLDLERDLASLGAPPEVAEFASARRDVLRSYFTGLGEGADKVYFGYFDPTRSGWARGSVVYDAFEWRGRDTIHKTYRWLRGVQAAEVRARIPARYAGPLDSFFGGHLGRFLHQVLEVSERSGPRSSLDLKLDPNPPRVSEVIADLRLVSTSFGVRDTWLDDHATRFVSHVSFGTNRLGEEFLTLYLRDARVRRWEPWRGPSSKARTRRGRPL